MLLTFFFKYKTKRSMTVSFLFCTLQRLVMYKVQKIFKLLTKDQLYTLYNKQ